MDHYIQAYFFSWHYYVFGSGIIPTSTTRQLQSIAKTSEKYEALNSPLTDQWQMILPTFFPSVGKTYDAWCGVKESTSTNDNMPVFKIKDNWNEMWMGRTNMVWMQLYIVNKVQLHLWLNDSLDCIPTSNFKAMQMFQGHGIPFLKFHVNYGRSIKQQIFCNEKNMFCDQCLSNTKSSFCTLDCKISVKDLNRENNKV